MNPFDWPGPAFLVFYVALSVVVCCGLWWFRRRLESPVSTPRIDDPFLVAALRGGADDAIRLALLRLLGRHLVVANDTERLQLAPAVTPAHVDHPIERAVVESLAAPRSVSDVLHVTRGEIEPDCQARLAGMGLLPDEGRKTARLGLWTVGFGCLMVVAAVKILIGLGRGRPVSLLVVSAVVVGLTASAVCFPRRTLSGDALVEHLKTLFESLKHRVGTASHRSGGPLRADLVNDVTWLAAVFGLGAVPTELVPSLEMLTRQEKQSGSTDSGGSSCSSGSSCGGGGGGCGGCGGD